jgi:hypothetical protein
MSRLNRKPIDVCSVIWRYVWQKRLDPDRRNNGINPYLKPLNQSTNQPINDIWIFRINGPG